uniref:Peptidase M12A domain-containing protein n=1 Tax=Gongylonema pulchrum TaxID=637853 RepID=A0A183DG77_9BILA
LNLTIGSLRPFELSNDLMNLLIWRNYCCLTVMLSKIVDSRTCRLRHKVFGLNTYVPRKTDGVAYDATNSIRTAHQTVYFWPSLTDHERHVLRDAFNEIKRRTCINFEEKDYQPWSLTILNAQHNQLFWNAAASDPTSRAVQLRGMRQYQLVTERVDETP